MAQFEAKSVVAVVGLIIFITSDTFLYQPTSSLGGQVSPKSAPNWMASVIFNEVNNLGFFLLNRLSDARVRISAEMSLEASEATDRQKTS